MGDIAEMTLNGDLDFYTGEYIGDGFGIPRTMAGDLPWEKALRAKEIKRELRKLIRRKLQGCKTIRERNRAVNEARAEINKKYGRGWRDGFS